MAEVKKGSNDTVQLAYTHKKPGLNEASVSISIGSQKHVIGFNKAGDFTLKRKIATLYVAKSRSWGLADVDKTPALSVVELNTSIRTEIPAAASEAPVAGVEGATLEAMGYNELIALAQSKGLEVKSGTIKKAELIEKLKALEA